MSRAEPGTRALDSLPSHELATPANCPSETRPPEGRLGARTELQLFEPRAAAVTTSRVPAALLGAMPRLPLSFRPVLCGGGDGFAWGLIETQFQSGSWNRGKWKSGELATVCPHAVEHGTQRGPGRIRRGIKGKKVGGWVRRKNRRLLGEVLLEQRAVVGKGTGLGAESCGQ